MADVAGDVGQVDASVGVEGGDDRSSPGVGGELSGSRPAASAARAMALVTGLGG